MQIYAFIVKTGHIIHGKGQKGKWIVTFVTYVHAECHRLSQMVEGLAGQPGKYRED